MEDVADEQQAPVDPEQEKRSKLRKNLSDQLKKRQIHRQKRPSTVPGTSKTENSDQKKLAEAKAALRAGRTNDPNNAATKRNYEIHRERVRECRAVVDTSAPAVPRNVYTKTTTFNRRLENFSRIERENALMLRRVSAILEGESTIDHRLKKHPGGGGTMRARQMKLFNITMENLGMLKRLQNIKPLIETKALLKDYSENERRMERLSMYPLFWKSKSAKGWEEHVERASSLAPYQYVFLTLGTEKELLGQIHIQLNYATTPMTAENFRCLCTGEQGGLSYKCSLIHRIVPGILWQGGDVTGSGGYGNKSIYGDKFPDENFKLKHDSEGIVSMANCGPDTNGSQFMIMARSTPALDGINVVFGKVVKGMDVLEKMNDYLGSTGTPKCDIFIEDCGMLDPNDIEESPAEDDTVQENASEPETGNQNED